MSERHRIWKLIELGLDPYITEYGFQVTSTAQQIKKLYNHLKPGESSEDEYAIAGRVMALRAHGKIVFAVLNDGTDNIQLVLRYDVLGENTWRIIEMLNVGDIVGVRGNPMRTLRGELSILAKSLKLLAITWREYPDKWHGIVDADKRYRMRYLDLMLNNASREAIITTYRIERAFRSFLDERNFIEIHTPKLQPVYGGALARPFITKMYALNRDVYLSIAPETYLKRAVVANFFKVYEIAVCFRNEDIDAQHYPEFVQIEIYWAFADWNDMMKLVEEMVSSAIKEVFGDYKIERKVDGDVLEIDFRPPWKRIPLEDAVEEHIKVSIKNKTVEELREIARSFNVDVANERRRGKIVEKLFEKFVQPNLVNPTFVTLFPRDISPLARPYRNDPRYAERFEVYVNRLEVGNGYSELNNPIVQYYFFKKEEELRNEVLKSKGIEGEFHPMDKDYVRALEFGMPPTAGVGIGIYRLVMAILGLPSIKDVIPFIIVEQDDYRTVAEEHPDILEYYIDRLQLDKV